MCCNLQISSKMENFKTSDRITCGGEDGGAYGQPYRSDQRLSSPKSFLWEGRWEIVKSRESLAESFLAYPLLFEQDAMQIIVLNLPLSSKNVMKMKVMMTRVNSMLLYNTRMTPEESQILELFAKPIEQRIHTAKTKRKGAKSCTYFHSKWYWGPHSHEWQTCGSQSWLH